MDKTARVDKFLWCVRIFKTRSLATEACKTNRVLMQEEPVKPSRIVKPGDEIAVRKQGIWFRFRVDQLLKNRVGAKLVPEYVTDITPEEEREKWKLHQIQVRLYRERGTGRPTKKDRRDMEGYLGEPDGWDDWHD